MSLKNSYYVYIPPYMNKTLPTLGNEKENKKLKFTKNCCTSWFSLGRLKISKCSISLTLMGKCSKSKVRPLWYKPLLLLSSTYWPFLLCKILNSSYSRSRVMRMCHFWAKNGSFAGRDGRPDRQTDWPYFIGPFQPRLGVQ